MKKIKKGNALPAVFRIRIHNLVYGSKDPDPSQNVLDVYCL
jgi:hypothetical protein